MKKKTKQFNNNRSIFAENCMYAVENTTKDNISPTLSMWIKVFGCFNDLNSRSHQRFFVYVTKSTNPISLSSVNFTQAMCHIHLPK